MTASLLLAGCATPLPETLLAGETMGSAWTVKIAGVLPRPAADLQSGAQARFEAVNQALSTYRANSALSRFNDEASGGWVNIEMIQGSTPNVCWATGKSSSTSPRRHDCAPYTRVTM